MLSFEEKRMTLARSCNHEHILVPTNTFECFSKVLSQGCRKEQCLELVD